MYRTPRRWKRRSALKLPPIWCRPSMPIRLAMRPERNASQTEAESWAKAKRRGFCAMSRWMRSICCSVSRRATRSASRASSRELKVKDPMLAFFFFFLCPRLVQEVTIRDVFCLGFLTYHGTNALQNWPPSLPFSRRVRSVCPMGISLIFSDASLSPPL